VLLSEPSGTNRDAERASRQVRVRAGDDSPLGDELGETFPRHDHDVRLHTPAQLGADRVRIFAE